MSSVKEAEERAKWLLAHPRSRGIEGERLAVDYLALLSLVRELVRYGTWDHEGSKCRGGSQCDMCKALVRAKKAGLLEDSDD